jgi:hypothetical protein
MKKQSGKLRQILIEFFQVCLGLYILLFVLEAYSPGFVSDFFPLHVILVPLLVSGVGIVIAPTNSNRRP